MAVVEIKKIAGIRRYIGASISLVLNILNEIVSPNKSMKKLRKMEISKVKERATPRMFFIA